MANNFQEKMKTRWYIGYGFPEKENQQDACKYVKTETNFKELAHMMVGSDKSTVSRAGRQAGYPGRVEVQVQSPSAGRILSSVGDSSFS